MSKLTGLAGYRLLDTNFAIAVMNGDALAVEFIREATDIFLCATVVGELYFGAYKSARPQSNKQRVEVFIAGMPVLATDNGTADMFGRIKSGLRTKGRPIPENDMWIAAVALQHGLTLVTRDAHFNEIDSLLVTRW